MSLHKFIVKEASLARHWSGEFINIFAMPLSYSSPAILQAMFPVRRLQWEYWPAVIAFASESHFTCLKKVLRLPGCAAALSLSFAGSSHGKWHVVNGADQDGLAETAVRLATAMRTVARTSHTWYGPHIDPGGVHNLIALTVIISRWQFSFAGGVGI